MANRDDLLGVHYREINKLKSELQDVRQKYDNQTVLLQQAEDDLRIERQKHQDDSLLGQGGEEGLKAGILRLQNEKHELEKELSHLKDENSRLTHALQDERLLVRARENELEEMKSADAQLAEQVASFKSLAGRQDKEIVDLKAKLANLNKKLEETLVDLDNKQQEVIRLATTQRRTGGGEGGEETMMVQRLKQQLLTVANEANARISDLQNQLQGRKQFVEGLKVEYQEFVQTTDLEKEAFMARHHAEYSRLKNEYDEYKTLQAEERRRILREQGDVLYAMQAQFDEYRTTAEFLFNTEAAKLEEKLNSQMLKYDTEMKYLAMVKDMQYDEMLTSKDAKIMNLMEGTDYQAQLIQHEMEIETLKRNHTQELEVQKEKAKNDFDRKTSELRSQINVLQMQQETDRVHRADLERKIRETFDMLEKAQKQVTHVESMHDRELAVAQKQVEEVNACAEKLRQEKEHLRHRILRLKMEIRGNDVTTEGRMKRLGHEFKTLQDQYGLMLPRFEQSSQHSHKLAKLLTDAQTKVDLLTFEVNKRGQLYQKLVNSFEMFVKWQAADRARRKDLDKQSNANNTMGENEEFVVGHPSPRQTQSNVVASNATNNKEKQTSLTPRPPEKTPQSPILPPMSRAGRTAVSKTRGHSRSRADSLSNSEKEEPEAQPRLKFRRPSHRDKIDRMLSRDTRLSEPFDVHSAQCQLAAFRRLSHRMDRGMITARDQPLKHILELSVTEKDGSGNVIWQEDGTTHSSASGQGDFQGTEVDVAILKEADLNGLELEFEDLAEKVYEGCRNQFDTVPTHGDYFEEKKKPKRPDVHKPLPSTLECDP